MKAKRYRPAQGTAARYAPPVPASDKPPGARPSRAGLYGRRWSKYRAAFLARPENVLCRTCRLFGRVTPAVVVDHIVPHRGDQELFWRESNHQPLCWSCHSRKTDSEDGGWGNPRRPHPPTPGKVSAKG